MTRIRYGHAELDALLDLFALDSAGATAQTGVWPPILIRMATHWFEHTQPAGGRIVFSSPTALPWHRPSHQCRSDLIDTTVSFANIGVATVKALAGLLADDPLRNAYFGAADAPDVPLRIDLDVEPVPAATPDAAGIGGTVALIRVTAPQHVPARFWPDDMETGAQERVTSIDYPQMLKTVSATWRDWLGN